MQSCLRSVRWTAALLPALLGTALAAPGGLWLNVPFVHQKTNGCGAACISMVMQYWQQSEDGRVPAAADAGQIERTLYNPQAKGIYAADMERYFRQNGFRVFAFSGQWQDLKHHLSKGRPLIVSLGEGRMEPLHYVVVVGLDWQEHVVLVNDPAQRKLLKMDRSRFEKRWRATDNWTLLAVPWPAR
ncbi:MAG: C39 family peptidase [Acidobacteria bacterium]|nr:C39 family peptidase [Acidobacteriota bacterium]